MTEKMIRDFVDRMARIETKLDMLMHKKDWVKIGMLITLVAVVVAQIRQAL